MKSSRLFSFFLVLTLAFSFASCTEKARDAKYVFYFIGDGMGFSLFRENSFHSRNFR